MLQWQHGSYTIFPNESLALQPILSDGRQLMSQPCLFQTAIYSTYNQTELYQVRIILVSKHTVLTSSLVVRNFD
jgi:hypothetical protein